MKKKVIKFAAIIAALLCAFLPFPIGAIPLTIVLLLLSKQYI